MFRKIAAIAMAAPLVLGTSLVAHGEGEEANVNERDMSVSELNAYLDTLVDPRRPVLAEVPYRPVHHRAPHAEGDSLENPQCVLRVYGFLHKEVEDGMRVSLPAQTRCEKYVSKLDHRAMLSEQKQFGAFHFVGKNGALPARKSPADKDFWTDSKTDSRYLHQANVRVVCGKSDRPVGWAAGFLGSVEHKGQKWAANGWGRTANNCWISPAAG